eukprot:gene16295-1673_t
MQRRKTCVTADATKLREKLLEGGGDDDGDRADSALVHDKTTERGQDILEVVQKVLGIGGCEEVAFESESSNMGNIMLEFVVRSAGAQWEVKVVRRGAPAPGTNSGQMARARRPALRSRAGRDGSAVRDPGAKLLATILHKGVPLKYIDLKNNDIETEGARMLLLAVRENKSVVQLFVSESGQPAPLTLPKCMRLYALRRRVLKYK